METRHPIQRSLANEFQSICNHCGVMAAWTFMMLKKIWFFAFFSEKNDPLRENFQNSVPTMFIVTPIDVLFSWNSVDGKSVKSCVTYTSAKNSRGSPAVASRYWSMRITPKICQRQAPTMYTECSIFHPNQFTFGGLIPALVNNIRAGREVFSIFDWSLALSRITTKNSIFYVQLYQFYDHLGSWFLYD